MLEKLFKLKQNQTSLKQEAVAGLTTFMTMAYIIFVNPMMLADAGMDHGAVFVATCLAAAVGCLVMGLMANYPIALAPGMGLNAFFTYTVVGEMGYSWETALGAVFLSGICFLILSLVRIREWIVNSIPMSLRIGIAAGIGLFLALIGLKSAGIVVASPATLVTLGDITAFPAVMAVLGFFLIIAMVQRGMKSAVILSILIITGLGLVFGDVQYHGIVSMPPSIMPTFLKMDLSQVFEVSMLSVVFAFLFVDLFDTSGTLVAVAQRGGFLDEKGRLPRLNRALTADSLATIAGAAFGTSTTTSYIESTAGVSAGGRTGLTAVVVGLLFIAALFLSPLAGMIPAYATAGTLFYVAILMMSGLVHVEWEDLTEAAPVVVVCILMPLTFSIATGIAFGMISYAAIKLLTGRFSDLNVGIVVLAALFVAKFIYG
ncbi:MULTISPECIES: NCS2 family permease [Shewanella]|jgi:AGZA family xanthine/uracil permease-like MFS transporter|uniref:Xanthine/uracil/vitamin C permease n=2 Tax=Shewanella baltica TaxID=62322 RepID=A9L0S4_SHEB9|nr:MULTISPECIES: NCS2 family permease [Shewanella]ABN62803.1 Xanthine/uracil/vitamin C permease [Shewanella baltica OS155]ABX50705.1 Xanthine/uracil/vitamin C permease [Shewanella baltica OS195]ACK45551.1 Xanthine/uracil/vitamin C permease [Shewanella baltica OS223]ADT95702.1 Xanthine/uracil/vitamin C permease [Shewanella baltica OS678]AEH15140.1 Xanthine/uracil/vitamin C permease [Shewanella baltica OS117]